jgi:hypothetical protein
MHAPILDSDHAPDDLALNDDAAWAAACAEFGADAKAHAADISPDRLRAAAFIFIDVGGLVHRRRHGLQHARGQDHHVRIAQPGVDDEDHRLGEQRLGKPRRPHAEHGVQDGVDLAEVLVEQALEHQDADEARHRVGQEEQGAVGGAKAQAFPVQQHGEAHAHR